MIGGKWDAESGLTAQKQNGPQQRWLSAVLKGYGRMRDVQWRRRRGIGTATCDDKGRRKRNTAGGGAGEQSKPTSRTQ